MATNETQIVDELVTDPSMVAPTLFVGLGGCGCEIAARVAKHLKRHPNYEERYKDLVKFALVDTNINDLESYRQDADETFLISDFEKEEYADFAAGQKFLDEDEYFTQWIPQDYRFRAGDTAGAGQIRIESRLGCYYQMKHGDFVPKFRRLLEDLKSHEHGHRRLDSDEIRIFVCYSVAGGTGSGSHLPLAYMLRDQAKALGKPTMIGVSVLPAVFEDVTGANKDGTFANGYAALKEMEHLMKLGAPDSQFYPEDGIEFHYNPSDTSKTHVNQRPFDFVYMVDKPESFSVDDVPRAAADGLYLQLFSPLFGEQASDYDNYTQHQRFLVPHDFEAKGIAGYTQFYGSYGAAVMIVPVNGLVDYCSRKVALSLMEQNFLGAIPQEPTYASLRANYESFYKVKERDEEDAPFVERSEFHKKEPGVRKTLRDRLFQRRVRLLAKCEHNDGQNGRFMQVFRQGHRLGTRPMPGAKVQWENDKEKISRQRRNLADRRWNYSIGALVLEAVSGRDPKNTNPGLLSAAEVEMSKEAGTLEGRLRKAEGRRLSWWKQQASAWKEDLEYAGREVVEEGYFRNNIDYPGMEALTELKFLDEADEVSLTGKRYAVLQILEDLNEELGGHEHPGEFDVSDYGSESDKIEDKQTVEQVVDELMEQAKEQAFVAIRNEFAERRKDLRGKLQEARNNLRSLEQGFGSFKTEQEQRVERLRREGDEQANQFILDTEAFQEENGRRLWDFYYTDEIEGLAGLQLSDPEVQRHISGTVRAQSMEGSSGASVTLQEMFDKLKGHAEGLLERHIDGDPRAEDKADRYGLTLKKALELEIEYRRLHQQHLDEMNEGKFKTVREIVARHRAGPEDHRVSLSDLPEEKDKDYLRDKIKRTVQEKASLLCSYDEALDEHGGVRPAEVYLACIDDELADAELGEQISKVDSSIKLIEEGWNDPQKVIFYRSALNVPPYVFGRMGEMKDYYYRFKNLAKRSKVLHIDKNWETSLPDLDPASAQEEHRQELVRRNIINFGVLLTIEDHLRDKEGFIVHREGTYYLRPPRPESSLLDGGEEEPGLAPLGETLAESIERLPEVLGAEKVKYRQFQQVLKAVRNGLAPQVLLKVVELPIKWRENRDQLRTQYGSDPSHQQKKLLKDYTDSFNRMKEALEALLEELRNIQTEQMVVNDDSSFNIAGLNPQEASENLSQSIRILDGFLENWKAIEDPDANTSVPSTFKGLFNPLNPAKLNRTLEDLREGRVGRQAGQNSQNGQNSRNGRNGRNGGGGGDGGGSSEGNDGSDGPIPGGEGVGSESAPDMPTEELGASPSEPAE